MCAARGTRLTSGSVLTTALPCRTVTTAKTPESTAKGVGRTKVADNGLVKEELRRSEAEQSGSGVIIGVTVTIIAVLIAVIVVGGVIIYRRTRPKGEIKKVLVHNDANDPDPVINQSGADGRVTLSKLKAHFSKSKLNSEIEDSGASAVTSAGVANPVYVGDRNQGIIMEEASIERPTNAGYDI
ncbi:uncharacterized protein LOC127859022 [Dreissena polymorpha]|uniref:uncharacterized protein LOC127859022 n=1 Tax=Dreissena polymorpha TaxID=45954 RepID=UPI0022647D44|nr:uncharacterized protein LOC127859022 [Dreissena polymorpha]